MDDDTGVTCAPPGAVRRVVSLVPSLTEAIEHTAPGLLVGATDWCSHPVGLDVARVRGTKNPNIDRVVALHPDVVVANFEENRPTDIEALRDAGIPVWVTVIRTLPEALASLGRMLAGCGTDPAPAWLRRARDDWADACAAVPPAAGTAVVPIWRRPWMVLGGGTFAGDMLARLGVSNVYAGSDERYPRVPLAELNESVADLVVLPDEPYAFSLDDGPESFPGLPAALVSGRDLTWYGPSLAGARNRLASALAAAG